MNNKIKLSLLIFVFICTTSGCSKRITQASSIQEPPQQTMEVVIPITSTPEINIVEEEPQDTIMNDVVEIPQTEEEHEKIIFSEEQSKSIVLPEYKNIEIDDMSLILKEMSDKDFHYPADTTSYVTSPYGWRHRRMHSGVDIKVYTGDNIYAAFDGVVRLAKYCGAYGYAIVIHHYNGLETLYAHSSKLLVKVNDVVTAGQVIALGGSTGRSTGSHLHFEVRVAGSCINPNLVIDTKKHSLQDKNLYITRRNNRIFASNNDSAEEREADIIEELSIKYHIVRSGDVLSRIAVNNHTTVGTICRLNNISSRSTLRIGQRLIVRGGIRPATKASTKQQTIAANTTTTTYTVKSGDTLSQIAARNHTTVRSICQLNNISTHSTLRIGQKLTLPKA